MLILAADVIYEGLQSVWIDDHVRDKTVTSGHGILDIIKFKLSDAGNRLALDVIVRLIFIGDDRWIVRVRRGQHIAVVIVGVAIDVPSVVGGARQITTGIVFVGHFAAVRIGMCL